MSIKSQINLWKPEYLLELSNMDRQHRHLFHILDVIHKLTLLADRSVVKNSHVVIIMNELQDYAKKHFRDEELMLSVHRYSGIDEQKSDHKMYQDFVQDYVDNKICVQNMSQEGHVSDETFSMLTELEKFIASWWDEHILKKDKLYADYTINKRKKNRIG